MTVMIPPADMLLFATVVREGGFTRAAKQLGVTKQTVSERVAKLEERLGVRLLERTTRRLRTTDVGATYYERCNAIAALVDEANGEVQRQQAEPVGLLRVSAPALYGRRFLGPQVAEFLRRYPRTRVDVVLADRRVDLIAEGFDLAIRVGRLDDTTLTARKLGETSVHCVASPKHLAAHGKPTPATLRSARCIGTQPFETWTVAGVETKVEPVLVVNDLELAHEAALAGVGLARLPAVLCRDSVRTGRLRLLFGPEPLVKTTAYAVFPSRRHLPIKVRLFVDALVATMEPLLPLAVERRRR
jgi:DNA-binding transcriptional LysR family regulator